jgi:hypothetical protein
MTRTVSLLLSTLFISAISFAADEPVRVTTFETSEGKKYEALNWSSFNSGDLKTYVLSTIDGRKTMLLESDVVRKTERFAALDSLPNDVQVNIRAARFVAENARVRAETEAREQKLISDARRGEREAESALRRGLADLQTAKNLITTADTAIRNAAVDLAAADARYDSAKTELSSLSSAAIFRVPYSYTVSDNSGRAEYLRREMVRAAEDRAHIIQDRKDAEDVIVRTKDNLKPLADRIPQLEKNRDAAKAQADRIIQEVKAAEKERAAKADAEMLIGKKP